jgi:hypothetical protein
MRKFVVPISILLAGALIAVAILLAAPRKSDECAAWQEKVDAAFAALIDDGATGKWHTLPERPEGCEREPME